MCFGNFLESGYFDRKGSFFTFFRALFDKFHHFGVGDFGFGIYAHNVVISKCVSGIFEKVDILAEKGLFRLFWDIFWTSFVILLLGTYNSEYMLTIWKFKNVFLEFLKKSRF